ncbi:MAG: nucleotidyl transferase AbiEii/AbiGii toxin family protein [Candidatus Aminicenantaceae bacterium]
MMKIYSPKASVELIHLVLLDLLGRKVDKKQYALKGGCNLRFFFKSIRYSDDMDLDISSALPKDKLQVVMNRIIESKSLSQILDVKGIKILESSSPKQTETTQRWKFTLNSSQSSVPLRTKIEFSRRGIKPDLAFDSVDANLIREYELTPILASHYNRIEACAQKVIALATRRKIQARDVFDLYFLLASGIDTEVLYEKTAKYADKSKENIWEVSYDMFKSQVVSNLELEYQAQYSSPELWDSMILTVVTALGKFNK